MLGNISIFFKWDTILKLHKRKTYSRQKQSKGNGLVPVKKMTCNNV